MAYSRKTLKLYEYVHYIKLQVGLDSLRKVGIFNGVHYKSVLVC